jgi:hypothetical protein
MPDTVLAVPGNPPRGDTSTRPPTILTPNDSFGSRDRTTVRASPQNRELDELVDI